MRGKAELNAVEELAEKQMKRGWFVGGEDFRKWLARQLPERGDPLFFMNRKQQRELAEAVERDETFAFIAGYTSGGAPYGVTWDEWSEPLSGQRI